MKLIVLRAGDAAAPVAARRGEFFSWITREVGDTWAGEWLEHDMRKDEPLPGPHDADGFVITGSSSSVTERAPWMLRGEELIRGIAAAGTPLFGICFGHQMVGQALGGLVAKNPSGREIGTVEVRQVPHDPLDPIFDGLPRELPREPYARRLGRPAAAGRTSPRRRPPRRSTRRSRSANRSSACSFTPRFDGDSMRGYVEARAHVIDGEGGDAQAVLRGVADAPHGASTLRSFVRHVVRARKR